MKYVVLLTEEDGSVHVFGTPASYPFASEKSALELVEHLRDGFVEVHAMVIEGCDPA